MKINHILAITALFFASTVGGSPISTAFGYELPLRGSDLKTGERYETFVHDGPGRQEEGKDIGARRYITESSWSKLTSDGADRKVLNNWVVYGKPFYAMAPGTVIGCWRNAPENTPGSLHPNILKNAGGGNHLWVLQDDGVIALYAHAQPGSIPSSLCPKTATYMTNTKGPGGAKPDLAKDAEVTNGARIKTGQLLGVVGNSGSSSDGPHLHVHMEKDGKPIAMKFDRGITTSFEGGKASLNGPWAGLNGKKMPENNILFLPPRPQGNYTFNGSTFDEFQRLADHLYDSREVANTVTCKSNGSSYNSTWVPSTGVWAMHHGMTAVVAAEKHAYYTQKGYKRTSSYTCGNVSVAVWRKM